MCLPRNGQTREEFLDYCAQCLRERYLSVSCYQRCVFEIALYIHYILSSIQSLDHKDCVPVTIYLTRSSRQQRSDHLLDELLFLQTSEPINFLTVLHCNYGGDSRYLEKKARTVTINWKKLCKNRPVRAPSLYQIV